MAYCQTSRWQWTSPPGCPLGTVGVLKARSIFKGKRIVFLGDSAVRNVFYQFNNLIDPESAVNDSSIAKHANIHVEPIFMRNSSFEFYWAPLVVNITTILEAKGLADKADLVVLGSAAWQALHVRDIPTYLQDLDAMGAVIGSTGVEESSSVPVKKASFVWLQPTTVIDAHLVTPEKQMYMPESTLALYRKAFHQSNVSTAMHGIIDPSSACEGREATDGIHYSQDVYKVVAQMAVNSYILRVPALYGQTSEKKKSTGPKKTGGMSFPSYGAGVLVLAAVMLFTMDSFMGIGFLSLILFGRCADWDAAYGPLHKKILKGPNVSPKPESPGNRSPKSSSAEIESLLGNPKGDTDSTKEQQD